MTYPLMKPRRLTVEEFREIELNAPADERWELINGVVHKAQAGTTVRHNDIVQNVAAALRTALKRNGSKCRTSTENIRLDIADATSSVMPDVIVNCGEPRGASTTFSRATAVVEVISPSTSLHDKVEKLESYFTIDGLLTVLLIEQSKMHVVAHTRSQTGWMRNDFNRPEDIVSFGSLGVTLSLTEIYDEIDLDD